VVALQVVDAKSIRLWEILEERSDAYQELVAGIDLEDAMAVLPGKINLAFQASIFSPLTSTYDNLNQKITSFFGDQYIQVVENLVPGYSPYAEVGLTPEQAKKILAELREQREEIARLKEKPVAQELVVREAVAPSGGVDLDRSVGTAPSQKKTDLVTKAIVTRLFAVEGDVKNLQTDLVLLEGSGTPNLTISRLDSLESFILASNRTATPSPQSTVQIKYLPDNLSAISLELQTHSDRVGLLVNQRGTSHIIQFQDQATDILTIADGGATTLNTGSATIALTTTGLFDLNSGNLDIDSATTTIDTAANTGFSIDGNYASNVSVTGGNLTLSTITSGDLLLTSAAATTLTSTSGTLTLNATGQTVDLTASTFDIDAGTIDLSTQTVDVTLNNAVDAINFDSDTLSIDALNNRVGIGTTSPTATLHIASGGIRFPDNSLMTAAGVGSASSIGSTTDAILNADNDGNGSGEILFQINGANLMVMTNAGLFGIGTATPDSLLDIHNANTGASASDVFLTITQASTTQAADPYIDFEIGEDTSIWRIGVDDSDSNKFRIAQGAAFNATSSGITIDTAGQVGIGTTNPGQLLSIDGNLEFIGAQTLSTTASGLLTLDGAGGVTVTSTGGHTHSRRHGSDSRPQLWGPRHRLLRQHHSRHLRFRHNGVDHCKRNNNS